MSKHLDGFIAADSTLDAMTDAPARYATHLEGMVAEGRADVIGWREDTPKGRPTGERAAMLAEVKSGYVARGLSAKTAMQRVTRLTYALAILAANSRREDETEEAFITRCVKIRALSNAGDMDAILKAVKGSVGAPKRGPKTGPKKGPKTPEKTPEKPVTPADTGKELDAAWNALVTATENFKAKVKAHREAGHSISKAMVQQGTVRAESVAAFLAS